MENLSRAEKEKIKDKNLEFIAGALAFVSFFAIGGLKAKLEGKFNKNYQQTAQKQMQVYDANCANSAYETNSPYKLGGK